MDIKYISPLDVRNKESYRKGVFLYRENDYNKCLHAVNGLCICCFLLCAVRRCLCLFLFILFVLVWFFVCFLFCFVFLLLFFYHFFFFFGGGGCTPSKEQLVTHENY